MVGHGRSSASSYLADPTSPIPSHCAAIVVTSTLRVNILCWQTTVNYLPHSRSVICCSHSAHKYQTRCIFDVYVLTLSLHRPQFFFFVSYVIACTPVTLHYVICLSTERGVDDGFYKTTWITERLHVHLPTSVNSVELAIVFRVHKRWEYKVIYFI